MTGPFQRVLGFLLMEDLSVERPDIQVHTSSIHAGRRPFPARIPGRRRAPGAVCGQLERVEHHAGVAG